MNIENFSTLVRAHDVARTNNYVLEFALPPKLVGFQLDTVRDLCLLCNQAAYPGRSFDTMSPGVNYQNTPVPYQMAKADLLSASFYVDGSFNALTFLEAWQNLIKGDQNGNNIETSATNFQDSFVTDIKLHMCNREGKVVKSVAYYRAFPKLISPVPLDGGDNKAMVISVNFEYAYWGHTESPQFLSPQNQKSPWERIQGAWNTVKPYVAARVPAVGQVDTAVDIAKRVGTVANGIFR